MIAESWTVLQKKGRMSNADLSETGNLSPSACHRRVQRLEKDGYIRDYVALLDPRKMGRPTTVFVEITLQRAGGRGAGCVRARGGAGAGCAGMSPDGGHGGLPAEGRGRDTEDFARIHRRYLARLPGVAQMQSSFALRTVRKTTAMPV